MPFVYNAAFNIAFDCHWDKIYVFLFAVET